MSEIGISRRECLSLCEIRIRLRSILSINWVNAAEGKNVCHLGRGDDQNETEIKSGISAEGNTAHVTTQRRESPVRSAGMFTTLSTTLSVSPYNVLCSLFAPSRARDTEMAIKRSCITTIC
jgi:hypothetical protein